MNIIITGGTGFIGYHIAMHHVTKGDEVFIIDNLYKNKGETDSELAVLLDNNKCTLINIDLTKEIRNGVLPDNIDIVYHLAAINGTELFYEIPYEVTITNILITINLLKYFENKKIQKIIFSSTSEVYAGGYDKRLVEIPTDENVPVYFSQPTDIRFSYGTSKFVSEFICHRFSEKFNIPLDIIRYHNIYGPRMGNKHVMPQLIKRFISGENPIEIFGSNETRAFCYIDDAVKATINLAMLKGDKTNVFHVGDDREEIPIMKLAELISDIMQIKVTMKHKKGKSSSVKRRCPNIDKLRKSINFEPSTDLRNGLEKTINWYVKN